MEYGVRLLLREDWFPGRLSRRGITLGNVPLREQSFQHPLERVKIVAVPARQIKWKCEK
jgi:hypothetical protein